MINVNSRGAHRAASVGLRVLSSHEAELMRRQQQSVKVGTIAHTCITIVKMIFSITGYQLILLTRELKSIF